MIQTSKDFPKAKCGDCVYFCESAGEAVIVLGNVGKCTKRCRIVSSVCPACEIIKPIRAGAST